MNNLEGKLMEFKLDEDIVLFAVERARALGAEYAEARLQRDSVKSYIVRNGVPEAIGISEDIGIGIRVLINGALGFASTDRWNDKKAIEEIINDAVKMAKAQGLGEERLSEEVSHKDKVFVEPKIDPENIDASEKFNLLMELDKTLQTAHEKAKFPNRFLHLQERLTQKVFANSEGTLIVSSVPRIRFMTFFVTAVDGKFDTRFVDKGEARGWEAIRDWNLDDLLKREGESLARVLIEGKEPPEGVIDVVLGTEVSALSAHEAVGHPYEADRILGREGAQAGESFVDPDMLGMKVGNDVLTVIDDPTIPNSFGFYLYDEEGVKARPRHLIKNGVITEFLHNRETAAKFGVKSNGAARASNYNREPIVRMANTYIAAGDMTFEELIEDIKLGVYIKTFGEWNIDDLRYNMRFVGKESWLIENGQLKHLVRNPILEITTPAFYKSIDAVDKNLEFYSATCGKGDPGQGVPVFTGGPNVRLRNIRVLKR